MNHKDDTSNPRSRTVAVGDVIHNPVHGETIRFLQVGDGGEDPALRVEVEVQPQASGPPAHVHPLSTETFEVLSGAMMLRSGRSEQLLTKGQTFTVEPKIPHTYWNHTDQQALVVIEFQPGVAMVNFLDKWFQLARDGELNSKGMARPLQTAVLFDAYLDSIAVPVVPIAIQRQILRLVGRWGRSRGYTA